MEPKEEFEFLLADFERESGVKLERQDDGSAILVVGESGETIVNLELLPTSRQLLAWARVGNLGDDENAAERAKYLLSVNIVSYAQSGFVLALDERNDEVIAHDIRPLEWFDSADRFAAWLEELIALVTKVRIECEEFYPYVDDEEVE